MTVEPMPSPSPSYPVSFDVEQHLADRNRLTCAFRLILAIPHLILVGGVGSIVPIPIGVFWGGNGLRNWGGIGLGSGLIGAAAGITSIISWFAIVFTGKQPRGLWDFTLMYTKWRANASAYTGLLRDEYPPFGTGDSAYPVTFEVGDFPEERDRVSVGFRIFLLIPHAIVLLFIGIAWFFTAVIGWFAILFTGSYPEGLYNFAIGYMRWSMRVSAYALLMRDEYPPFSLN